MKPFRVFSWNVNGIRACLKKGFFDWLKGSKAGFVGIQETRATEAQVLAELPRHRWHTHFLSAEKKGYSGVGAFSRREMSVSVDLPPIFLREGRAQFIQLGALTIVNAYFPNGSGKNRDHSRVPYKREFYREVFDRVDPSRPLLIMGDFNTAHREIDLARPKTNRKTSGFLDVEREDLDLYLGRGYVDTYRHFHPDKTGAYTWWSQRFGVRERNVGWRIDMAWASPALMPFVTNARIHPKVMGSDHCPISVDLDPRVFDAI